jgi:hypothetical protein
LPPKQPNQRRKQKERELVIDWRPQEKQLRFLRSAGLATLWGYADAPLANEILYGGAAGSGKTASLVAACINRCLTVPNARVIYFRRSFPELAGPGGVIDYALSVLPQTMSDGSVVFKYLKSEHKFEFFNGSTWTFAHLQHEADKYKYQGTQVDLAVFDELTHFTETMYMYFALSRVRKWRADLQAVPITLAGTNPGGIGHGWVKARFVDAYQWGESFIADDGRRRLFVPARLTDNKILMDTDPTYIKALDALPEAERKALKDGDWDSYAGQFFSEWSRRTHVIKPFEIPKHWPRSAGYDYGYGAAAAHLWFAMDPATNLAYCYREYVTAKETDPGRFEGVKVAIPLQAQNILDRERESGDPHIEWRAADPSIFAVTQANTGESISETFATHGVHFDKGDNRRVHGAQRVHSWLTPWVDSDGNPISDEHGPIANLRFFDTCRYMVATLPALPHDMRNPEDIDTHAEDHGYDSLRMWAMNRPEPEGLVPFKFRRPVKRKLYADEIEDAANDDTPPIDERGLLMPVRARRG